MYKRNKEIIGLYKGTTKIYSIYKGNILVWQTTPDFDPLDFDDGDFEN